MSRQNTVTLVSDELHCQECDFTRTAGQIIKHRRPVMHSRSVTPKRWRTSYSSTVSEPLIDRNRSNPAEKLTSTATVKKVCGVWWGRWLLTGSSATQTFNFTTVHTFRVLLLQRSRPIPLRKRSTELNLRESFSYTCDRDLAVAARNPGSFAASDSSCAFLTLDK